MSRKKTPAPARKPTMARWPAPAAGAIIAVMIGCAALAATASVPTAAPAPATTPATLGPEGPTQAAPPAPSLGQPYLADRGNGLVAKVTIKTAVFTSPAVLTLDVDWDSWAGTTTPSPDAFEVLDGTGARAAVHQLSGGALPTAPVPPGSPVHGRVAFDIMAGPATLVIKPSGALAPTRIVVKR